MTVGVQELKRPIGETDTVYASTATAGGAPANRIPGNGGEAGKVVARSRGGVSVAARTSVVTMAGLAG